MFIKFKLRAINVLVFLIVVTLYSLLFNGIYFMNKRSTTDNAQMPFVHSRRSTEIFGVRATDDAQMSFLSVSSNDDVHVFSVIAINTTDGVGWDLLVANIWLNNTPIKNLLCCFILLGGRVTSALPFRINQRKEMFNLTAQIECPIPLGSNPILSGVTVTSLNECSPNLQYVKPYYPVKPSNEFNFAICGKIVYGDIDVSFMIEWMEYHRHMGVGKVLLYPYNLSSVGTSVLEYYQRIGLVQLVPFTTPYSATGAHRVGSKTTEAWNDEQVVVYDCQSRLRGYDFVGVIDLDEFIVPVIDRDLHNMLNRLLYVLPNMAAVDTYSEMFVTDWGKTNTEANLVIAQYENRTVSNQPIDINQRKVIHIPARVERGSVVTHGCRCLNDSYLIFRDPTSVIAINHYRRCVQFWDDCFTRERVVDSKIFRFLRRVHVLVERAKHALNVT